MILKRQRMFQGSVILVYILRVIVNVFLERKYDSWKIFFFFNWCVFKILLFLPFLNPPQQFPHIRINQLLPFFRKKIAFSNLTSSVLLLTCIKNLFFILPFRWVEFIVSGLHYCLCTKSYLQHMTALQDRARSRKYCRTPNVRAYLRVFPSIMRAKSFSL